MSIDWEVLFNHNLCSVHMIISASYIKINSKIFLIFTGWRCKRCCLENRLGWSSSPISALCALHHGGSQQGVQTDSWEICAGLQLDHDKRKNTNYFV